MTCHSLVASGSLRTWIDRAGLTGEMTLVMQYYSSGLPSIYLSGELAGRRRQWVSAFPFGFVLPCAVGTATFSDTLAAILVRTGQPEDLKMLGLKKQLALAAVAGASALLSVSSAQAQLSNIGGVRITQNANQPLQLGEVRVFQDGTGANVALAPGGTATASSIYDAFSGPEKANNGDTTSIYPADLYHSDGVGNVGEYWQVRFEAATIDAVQIFGRNEVCCVDRDQNLTLTLLDASGSPIAGPNYTYNFGIPDNDQEITIDIVPEPASLTLLGLGGLALLGRRRR